jgi:hypothetical protein
VLTIPAKARTAKDGTLALEVSTGIPDAELDVLIVIETARPCDSLNASVAQWPKGYFELFGSLREVNLERPPQGELQDRLPLK